MPNPFKVGDTVYCVRSGMKAGTAQTAVGTEGEVLSVPDADFVVVRWDWMESFGMTTPVVALSATPPEKKKGTP